ncbi:MAG: 4Fe-4S binding protein [Clostridia bacterium]
MRKVNVNIHSKISELPMAGIILDDGNSEDFNTGDWKNQKPVHDMEKCKNCMLCVPVCPEACIKHTEDDKMIGFDYDKCKGCGICAKTCPFKAISMEKE